MYIKAATPGVWPISGKIFFLLTFFPVFNYYHANEIILITGLIHWEFMTGIQLHHPYLDIHIVEIPCHPVESLQATNSSFIFILIM